MSEPIPLPQNHSTILPGELFRIAMALGIGHTNTLQKIAKPWDVDQVCQALQNYYINDKQKYDIDYTGTVNEWKNGRIPTKHRTAFFQIFTSKHLKNSQEWRDAFLLSWAQQKAKRKNRASSAFIEFNSKTIILEILPTIIDSVLEKKYSAQDKPYSSYFSKNVIAYQVFEALMIEGAELSSKNEYLPFFLLLYTGRMVVANTMIHITHEHSLNIASMTDLDWSNYTNYLRTKQKTIQCKELCQPNSFKAMTYLYNMMQNNFGDKTISQTDFANNYRKFYFLIWKKNIINLKKYFLSKCSDYDEKRLLFRDISFHIHRAVITHEAQSPMFANIHGKNGEPFSLADIYIDIPLLHNNHDQGYHTPQNKLSERINASQLVHDYLIKQWSTEPSIDNFLIIRGAPGSGKSSLLKEQLKKTISDDEFSALAILYIPLQQHGPFEKTDQSLILRGRNLPGFTYERSGMDVLTNFEASSFKKLLIVFDGLDELGRQDTKIKDMIHLSKVIELLDHTPKSKPIKFIIAGRDQPFQHLNYPNNQNRISYRLLGLAEDILEMVRTSPKIDKNDIRFEYDYRDKWLEKYTAFKFPNQKYKSPQIFKNPLHSLYELTQEPLLLFLLCRLASLVTDTNNGSKNNYTILDLDTVYYIDNIDGLNKNDVFQMLIKSVREAVHREPADHERPESEGGITEHHFEKVLTCLAMPAWRNQTGRRATVYDFLKEAKREHLESQAKSLVLFARGESPEATQFSHLSLLSVFYFRTYQSDTENIDEFEFTHKSFASYLIASRVFNAAIKLALELKSNPQMNLHNLLQNWVDLVSYGDENQEVHNFIEDEAKRYLRVDNASINIFKGLAKNIGDYPGEGAVLHSSDLEPIIHHLATRTFLCEGADGNPISPMKPAMMTQRRTFRIFFSVWGALVNAYGESFGEIYKPISSDFSELLHLLIEPANTSELENIDFGHADFLASSLRYLNLTNQNFSGLKLINADFSSTNLENAQFHSAILNFSLFYDAYLENVTFLNCSMPGVIFDRNNNFSFYDCIVRQAHLSDCQFKEVKFERSDFSGTQFEDCTFEQCHFELSSLNEVIFINCTFNHTTFLCCIIQETEMENCILQNTNFINSILEEITISKDTQLKNVTGLPKK